MYSLTQPNESTNSSQYITKPNEIRAANTMLLVIASFMMCWVPLTIKLAKSFKPSLFNNASDEEEDMLGKIISYFGYCAIHSAIDPIIYAYRIKDVRDAIKKTFRCCFRFRVRVSSPEISSLKDYPQSLVFN